MSFHWKTIAIWKVGSSPEVARSSAKDMIVIRRIDDWKNRQAGETVAVGVVIVVVIGVNQELGNRVGC
jgi:negative regulator of sigma E activity